MNEKKRAKMMRICRIAALVLAVIIIVGVVVQPLV